MLPFSILQSVVHTLLFALSASGSGVEAFSASALSSREAWFVASFLTEEQSRQNDHDAVQRSATPDENDANIVRTRSTGAQFYRYTAKKRRVVVQPPPSSLFSFSLFSPSSLFPSPLFSSVLFPSVLFSSPLHAATSKTAIHSFDAYLERACAAGAAFDQKCSLVKLRKTFVVCANMPRTLLSFLPRSGALSDRSEAGLSHASFMFSEA